MLNMSDTSCCARCRLHYFELSAKLDYISVYSGHKHLKNANDIHKGVMIRYMWIVSGSILWNCFNLNFIDNIGVLINLK